MTCPCGSLFRVACSCAKLPLCSPTSAPSSLPVRSLQAAHPGARPDGPRCGGSTVERAAGGRCLEAGRKLPGSRGLLSMPSGLAAHPIGAGAHVHPPAPAPPSHPPAALLPLPPPAPAQVLGSLSLLFNPTGLVQSVRAGVSDLIGLPLAALQNQSLTEFVSGVGMGSVSLVKHTLGAPGSRALCSCVPGCTALLACLPRLGTHPHLPEPEPHWLMALAAAGWTLTSISGFSQAFSRAVDSAVTLRTGTAGGGAGGGALAHRPPPSHLGHGLTQVWGCRALRVPTLFAVWCQAARTLPSLPVTPRSAPLSPTPPGPGRPGRGGGGGHHRRGASPAARVQQRQRRAGRHRSRPAWGGGPACQVGGWVKRRGFSPAPKGQSRCTPCACLLACALNLFPCPCLLLPRNQTQLSCLMPLPSHSGALELVGSVSAGLASSAGVVHVPQPRRPGRLLTAGGGGGAAGTASGSAGSNSAAGPTPLVTSAARLMQHPALLGHSATFAAGDGLGRYLAHAALMAATVLQGAEGLRGTRCAAGHALQQPVLLVTQRAAVLFSAGGLAPVLVLLLAETGESCSQEGGTGRDEERAQPLQRGAVTALLLCWSRRMLPPCCRPAAPCCAPQKLTCGTPATR